MCASVRLLCRRESFINPRELMTVVSPANLFGVVGPYRAPTAEDTTQYETRYRNNVAVHTTWSATIQSEEPVSSPMELEHTSSSVTTTPMLTPHSSSGNRWSPSREGSLSDVFDTIGHSSLASADEDMEDGVWEHQLNIHSNFHTYNLVEAEAPQHEHINDGDDPQIASKEMSNTSVSMHEDALAGTDALEPEYLTAISALATIHHSSLVQFIQCIGSSSAVLSLRLIVRNFRELQRNSMGKEHAMRIAATRSSAERLAAIDDLSACMAHFTLAQRMHIYMLYKEALNEEGLNGEAANNRNAFVLESGVSSVRSPGNPGYLQRAAISRNMTVPGQKPSRAKRLRRVGCRLDVLVQKFERGVLALLDEKLTHEM